MSNESHRTALIGYTGFVGSNLLKQYTFDDIFNSSNIKDVPNQSYNLVISAAPSAVKWKANKFPDEDKKIMDTYAENLRHVSTKKLICISTCDVYQKPINVDESTSIEETLDTLHPYGLHRFWLEEFVRAHFSNHLIVRLPALFGDGLKKNAFYDLIHNHMIENIHSESTFQFYNLANLWKDISIALKNNLSLVNITTEPVSMEEVAEVVLSRKFKNVPHTNPASYNVQSQHADLYGGHNGYMYTSESVLTDMKQFANKIPNS